MNKLKNRDSSIWKKISPPNLIENIILQVETIFNQQKDFALIDTRILTTQDKYDIWNQQFPHTHFQPLMTFHGTSQNNLNSIIQNGYIMPDVWTGDPGHEYPHRPSNGSFLGEGIYSTTDPLISKWFSDIDSDGNFYLLVNLVQINNYQQIKGDWGIIKAQDGYFPVKFKSKWENIHGYSSNKVDGNIPHKLINNLRKKELQHFYQQKDEDIYIIDTNMSFDQKVIVSASSDYILPILAIQINARKEFFNFNERIDCLTPGFNYPHLNMYHLTKDWFFLNDDLITHDNHLIIHRVQPLDMNTLFCDRIKDFIGSLGKCRLYIYDNKGLQVDLLITHHHQVTPNLLKYTTKQALVREEYKNEPEFIQTIKQCLSRIKIGGHLYLIEPEKELLFPKKYSKYRNFSLDKSYNFKKIHLRIISSCTDRNFNTGIPYETLKDYKSIYKLKITPPSIKITSKYPYGRFGTGWVERLQDIPSWDAKQPYLFKGMPPEYMWVDGEIHRVVIKEFEDLEDDKKIVQNWHPKKDPKIVITEHNPDKVESINGLVLLRLINDFKTFAFSSVDKYRYYLPILQELIEPILEKNLVNKNVTYLMTSCLNEMSVLNKASWLESKWFRKLLNMRYRKNIVKRNLKYITDDDKTTELNLSNIKGNPINVITSDASQVDPWLLIVRPEDNFEDIITADKNPVLPITMNIYESNTKAYLSYLYTDSPYCYINGQKNALLAITWCQLDDADNILTERVRLAFENYKLPESITEKDDVTSICKLMAIMIAHQGEHIPYNYFNILAECIMRGARVAYKVQKECTRDEFLDKFLIMNNDQLDLKKSSSKLWKYFNNWWMTNLSPYDCVKVLGWIDDTDYSMKNFLTKFLPDYQLPNIDKQLHGTYVTLALWVHGIRYHKAKDRIDFKNFDPNVLDVIVKQQLKRKKLTRLKLEKILHNQKNKKLRFIIEADKYKEYHQDIKLFTHDEVVQHNLLHPTDPWVLMPSGTLKYRCCYIDCPQYLIKQNSSTETKSVGNKHVSMSRNGLFKHLKYNRTIHKFYSGYHLICKQLYHNHKLDKLSFCNQVFKHFFNDPMCDRKELEKYAEDYWNWRQNN